MAGRPKTPKPKPINQARIAQVQQDIDGQTARINTGLQQYKVQALNNIGQQTLIQRQAIDNSISDAQINRVRLEQLRSNTLPLLQQRNAANQQMNSAATNTAKASTRNTARSVAVAQNTKIMKRKVAGI